MTSGGRLRPRARGYGLSCAALLAACTAPERGNADATATAPVERPSAAAPAPARLPPVVSTALAAYDAEVGRRRAAFRAAWPRSDDWRAVRARLAHMVDVDQYTRGYPRSDIVVRFDEDEQRAFAEEYARRWRAVDRRNTDELKALLETHGWFTISAFGPQADRDAWLLVQHADHDVAFQREVLEVLAGLVDARETDVRNYAYLYDRVAVAEERPQRYGTQGRCVAPARWEPFPIEDPARVDARRAEVDLEPMAEYVARFVELCG